MFDIDVSASHSVQWLKRLFLLMLHFDAPREFGIGLLYRQQIHFEKIDKIAMLKLCMVCCSVLLIRFGINATIFTGLRVACVSGGVVKTINRCIYILYKVGSEVMVIERNICIKIQFHFDLCINCIQAFKLIRINCVSIIIYCSLFTFFLFIFRYFKVCKCNNRMSLFWQGFFVCFTYMTLLFCDKDTVWKFACQRVNWWGW